MDSFNTSIVTVPSDSILHNLEQSLVSSIKTKVASSLSDIVVLKRTTGTEFPHWKLLPLIFLDIKGIHPSDYLSIICSLVIFLLAPEKISPFQRKKWFISIFSSVLTIEFNPEFTDHQLRQLQCFSMKMEDKIESKECITMNKLISLFQRVSLNIYLKNISKGKKCSNTFSKLLTISSSKFLRNSLEAKSTLHNKQCGKKNFLLLKTRHSVNKHYLLLPFSWFDTFLEYLCPHSVYVDGYIQESPTLNHNLTSPHYPHPIVVFHVIYLHAKDNNITIVGIYHIKKRRKYHITRGESYHITRGGIYIIKRGGRYHYVLGKDEEGGRNYGRRGPDPQILGGRLFMCSLSDHIAIYAGACMHSLYCIMHVMFASIELYMQFLVAVQRLHSKISSRIQGSTDFIAYHLLMCGCKIIREFLNSVVTLSKKLKKKTCSTDAACSSQAAIQTPPICMCESNTKGFVGLSACQLQLIEHFFFHVLVGDGGGLTKKNLLKIFEYLICVDVDICNAGYVDFQKGIFHKRMILRTRRGLVTFGTPDGGAKAWRCPNIKAPSLFCFVDANWGGGGIFPIHLWSNHKYFEWISPPVDPPLLHQDCLIDGPCQIHEPGTCYFSTSLDKKFLLSNIMGIKTQEKIYFNNQASVKIFLDSLCNKQTRHTNHELYITQQDYFPKNIYFTGVRTKIQFANVLTKNLPPVNHAFQCNMVQGLQQESLFTNERLSYLVTLPQLECISAVYLHNHVI
ncbi:uncharacterized protein VP01_1211g4 [Puccinia sorghi]|uniref:Uncharacterized protein n=1 Tax=Puccinia sorghi TaxID=27349 RepID=A0A0L6VQF5_9BASI|nr:uncharacterized protein VP01_1211g4 [Puccinia sorghi]